MRSSSDISIIFWYLLWFQILKFLPECFCPELSESPAYHIPRPRMTSRLLSLLRQSNYPFHESPEKPIISTRWFITSVARFCNKLSWQSMQILQLAALSTKREMICRMKFQENLIQNLATEVMDHAVYLLKLQQLFERDSEGMSWYSTTDWVAGIPRINKREILSVTCGNQ